MEHNKIIGIIGGDERQIHLANSLCADGFAVITVALPANRLSSRCFVGSIGEAAVTADIIVLPLPTSREGITLNAPFSSSTVFMKDVWAALEDTPVVLGATADLPRYAKFKFIDYSSRDDFAVYNAVPTAEAALAIAINHTDMTLFDSKCLVIGYGRIGKILLSCLRALNADVTVSARKPADLAMIESLGGRAVHTSNIGNDIGEYDIIFNTVPRQMLNSNILSKCKAGTLIIDLASAPFGTDFAAAKALGIKAVSALSLPGKTAPKSAAKIIKSTLLTIIREEKL